MARGQDLLRWGRGHRGAVLVAALTLGAGLLVLVPGAASAAPSFAGPAGLSVVPNSGPAGTPVRVYGDNLDRVNAITFGGVNATSLTHLDSHLLTAVVPPLNFASGAVDVVLNPSDEAVTQSQGFFYTPAEQAVPMVTPATGLRPGDTVTVTATGYTPGTAVDVYLASPLLGFAEPRPGDPTPEAQLLASPTTDAGGTASAAVTLPAGLQAGDTAHAACPPPQEQVDAGLARCQIVVAEHGIHLEAAPVTFAAGTDASPPKLELGSATAVAGDTVTIRGGSWSGSPAFGSSTRPGRAGATPLTVEICGLGDDLSDCLPLAPPAPGTASTSTSTSGPGPSSSVPTASTTTGTTLPTFPTGVLGNVGVTRFSDGTLTGATLDGSVTLGSVFRAGCNCVVRVRQAVFGAPPGTFIEKTAPLAVVRGAGHEPVPTTTTSTTATTLCVNPTSSTSAPSSTTSSSSSTSEPTTAAPSAGETVTAPDAPPTTAAAPDDVTSTSAPRKPPSTPRAGSTSTTESATTTTGPTTSPTTSATTTTAPSAPPSAPTSSAPTPSTAPPPTVPPTTASTVVCAPTTTTTTEPETAANFFTVLPVSGRPGTRVTIFGSGVDGATSVAFGGVPGTAFTVQGPGSVTVNVPVGPLGVVDVVVSGPGLRRVLPQGFYIIPPDLSVTISPTTGLHPGDRVTLTVRKYIANQGAVVALVSPLVYSQPPPGAGPQPELNGPPPQALPLAFPFTSTGDFTTTITLPGTPTPFFDHRATCPITQEQADHGFGHCILALTLFARATIEVPLFYADDAAPQPPTLAVDSAGAAPGSPVQVTGTNWLGDPGTYASTAQRSLDIQLCGIGGNPARCQPGSGQVNPATYLFDLNLAVPSVMTGGELAGTITLPADPTPCQAYTVEVSQVSRSSGRMLRSATPLCAPAPPPPSTALPPPPPAPAPTAAPRPRRSGVVPNNPKAATEGAKGAGANPPPEPPPPNVAPPGGGGGAPAQVVSPSAAGQSSPASAERREEAAKAAPADRHSMVRHGSAPAPGVAGAAAALGCMILVGATAGLGRRRPARNHGRARPRGAY